MPTICEDLRQQNNKGFRIRVVKNAGHGLWGKFVQVFITHQSRPSSHFVIFSREQLESLKAELDAIDGDDAFTY